MFESDMIKMKEQAEIYKTWTGVHGPPHGPGLWTTPNFQKEIAPVNMKIYRRSGYEKTQTGVYSLVLEAAAILDEGALRGWSRRVSYVFLQPDPLRCSRLV